MQTLTQEKLQLDGAALRDGGMQKAEDHANAEIPGWSEEAREYLKRFLAQQGNVPFMSEYLSMWCHERGLPRPPHMRAWGSVISWARKNKLIEFVRHESVVNPKAHKAFASVWKAA